MSKKVVVLAGDGIGPEIMDATLVVFRELIKIKNWSIDIEELNFGGAAIDYEGSPFPEKNAKPVKQRMRFY